MTWAHMTSWSKTGGHRAATPFAPNSSPLSRRPERGGRLLADYDGEADHCLVAGDRRPGVDEQRVATSGATQIGREGEPGGAGLAQDRVADVLPTGFAIVDKN